MSNSPGSLRPARCARLAWGADAGHGRAVQDESPAGPGLGSAEHAVGSRPAVPARRRLDIDSAHSDAEPIRRLLGIQELVNARGAVLVKHGGDRAAAPWHQART